MGRRRGIIAEILHQAKQAEKERQRQEKAAEREYNAAIRKAEQAKKAELRAAAQLHRAMEKDRKQREKEAKQAHVEAMQAEAERRNSELAARDAELDSILAATLDVDDYVDLNELRVTVSHPPFDQPDLELPTPAPAEVPDPSEPAMRIPPEPTGLSRLFGGRRHRREVELAREKHDQALRDWQEKVAQAAAERERIRQEYEATEQARRSQLDVEKQRFASECAKREREAEAHNEALDQLITNLAYGAPEAVQEYVSIVLSNSVYPSHFQVEHEFRFNPETAELALKAIVPGPDTVERVKAYRYVKASDEFKSSDRSQKARKDQYSSAIHQIAIRTLHEVFEADRRGLIQSISLEVGTETILPATGTKAYVLFVAVCAEREQFMAFDLTQVVPVATLEHLGASVSKNPFDLRPTDKSGVRRSD